jgi:SAM-dependent methyltransferase
MLDSLHRRPRGKELARILASLTGGAVAGGDPPPPPTRPCDVLAALRAYVPPGYPEKLGPVTRALLDRLEEDDEQAILAAADAEWRAYYAEADAEKPHLVLHYAAHWGVEPALERTGLVGAQPPEDVHAMARGPRAAAGGTWFADLVADAAERAGVPMDEPARVLDFGCSSGRVLRVLAAWRPGVDWVGCDPNAPAVAWADANIPGVTAFASPQEPPLALDDASFDLVYAISIWSHFGPTQAERWLDEMRRILKPGGALVFTTQGFPTLAHFLRRQEVTEEYACARATELLRDGHAYAVAFGEEGDWGVKHPEWGLAYMSAEWLAARTLPAWWLRLYEPARVDWSQDLVVLVKG